MSQFVCEELQAQTKEKTEPQQQSKLSAQGLEQRKTKRRTIKTDDEAFKGIKMETFSATILYGRILSRT